MRLIKSFSIYALGTFLTQAINFLLIPVFTNYLTPEDYGILSLITTIMSFVAPFVILSIDGAISIEYYKDTFKQLGNYVTSSLLVSFFAFITIFIICFLFQSQLEKEFSIPGIYILLIPVVCFMDVIKSVVLILYQIQQKTFSYALFSLSNVVINIGLALLFIVVFKYNYVGRLYGQYIVGGVYFLFGVYLLYKKKLLNISINRAMMLDVFHYGLPLVPHSVGFIIINLADRLFISHYVGNEQLGIYSLAYTLGSIILLIAQAFNNAWVPNLLELLKKGDEKSKLKVVSITYFFLITLFILTVGLVVISPLLYKYFINEKFYDGLSIIPWIAFSSFFFGCYLAFTNFIFFLKKNKVFAYVSIINIILNLALNYILIRMYGIDGAGYATFVSFFAFAFIIIVISVKTYPMPWSTLKFSELTKYRNE